jgi:hypothetical protein
MYSTSVIQAPAVAAIADEAGSVRNLIDQTTANLIARVNAVSVIRAGKIPRCWVRPNMVRDSVFSAAATEPLLLTANNEPFFDPESFVAFLLESAEVDGHA